MLELEKSINGKKNLKEKVKMKAIWQKCLWVCIFSLVGVSFSCKERSPNEIEVLHWWTSGGEAKAMEELKKTMSDKGHKWKDFPVAGGGGSAAVTVLKSRVLSGNPPIAAQVKGPLIKEWAKLKVLAKLDEVVKRNQWNEKIPTTLQKILQHEGSYVAVPVNIHRNNWLWINKRVFDQAGLKPPGTWEEFEKAAEKLKKRGIIPVAHGGQAWQDNTVFELIVLATGQGDFYRKALVELDEKSLGSQTMFKVFQRFRKYKTFVDRNYSGRDWNLATSMVIQGKAGMQFMGDWAKGEFLIAKQKPGEDFIAAPAPGTGSYFVFTTDSFIFFKQDTPEKEKAIEDFAESVLSPSFQISFNLNKGSIPIDINTNMEKFDIYGKQSMQDFKKHTALPSMAHGMAVNMSVQGAIEDIVTNFFNSNDSAKEGVKRLVKAVREAKKAKAPREP